MIYLVYSIILWLATPFIVLYHCYRSVSRGRPTALAERFGQVPADLLEGTKGSETLWVHAVSVGETIAVVPLLKALKQRWPDKKIILSNVTETGREVAGKIAEVDWLIYFPFDYAFAAEKVLGLIRPAQVIVVETEIWPNFLRAARRQGIPVTMVNGRISDRSFPRYLRLRWFFGPVLDNFTALCMQSKEDARRITAMGADPGRVHVAGNLKYDVPLVRLDAEQRRKVREVFRIDGGALVVTAGSTHQGEEELVVEAFGRGGAQANAVLVLVPRHPERAAAVADLLRAKGFPFLLRSALDSSHHLLPGQVLLVDTVGELKQIYSLSDVVFVGGSLVPTGGHNVLEPASFGVPVLFGPHMSNFREISAAMLDCGGGIQVDDGASLEVQLHRLLGSESDRARIGSSGMNWLRKNSGSVELHMRAIAQGPVHD